MSEWSLFAPHTHRRLFFASSNLCTEKVLGAKKVTGGRGFTSPEPERSLRYFSRGPKKTETLRFLFPSLSIARPPGFVRIALVKFVSSHAPKGLIAIACLGPNFCVAAFSFPFRIMNPMNDQNSHQ